MKKNIAVLAGDGIGPEVMNEALKILDVIADDYHHEWEFKQALIGGAAWPVYGNHFPEETKTICEEADAILFGSVGGPVDQMDEPQWKDCEKHSILGLRKTFGFNANFRPVQVYPELADICPLKPEIIADGIDILFVRELVGGIYFGEHSNGENEHGRYAQDTMEYTEHQILSIAHTAFQAAKKRGKKVTSVDKSNVLDCSRLWKKIVIEVSLEYPEIELEHILVDNCAMQLIKNPSQFDVLLCPNMFGDILSDAGAVLPGSLGLMPSASLNKDGFGMYEPSGGSAPDIAGKGIANPIAQVLSAALMLRHSFGLEEEAKRIESAVHEVIQDGYRTGDIAQKGEKAVSTKEIGEHIRNALD